MRSPAPIMKGQGSETSASREGKYGKVVHEEEVIGCRGVPTRLVFLMNSVNQEK
jgi:hypothetical protein